MAAVARAVAAAALLAAARAYGDGAALPRVQQVERWLYEDGPPPAAWDVATTRDLPPSRTWVELGGGKSKRVRATLYAARPVVVKQALETRRRSPAHQALKEERGRSRSGAAPLKRVEGHERNVRGELLWLEYLRGAPGIPRLYGGFLTENGTRVSMVVQRAGHTLEVKGMRQARTASSSDWTAWCHAAPVEALRALLDCFRSFAEVGGSFLSDFSPRQFTVEGDAVYLVDGPDILEGPLYDVFRARHLPTMYAGPPASCAADNECPSTSAAHCAAVPCEPGARGTPEAKGACAGTCLRVSAKTHVYDVAANTWAFPYVLGRVEMPHAKKLALRRLQVWMMRPLVNDRPNFTEAIAALDGIS